MDREINPPENYPVKQNIIGQLTQVTSMERSKESQLSNESSWPIQSTASFGDIKHPSVYPSNQTSKNDDEARSEEQHAGSSGLPRENVSQEQSVSCVDDESTDAESDDDGNMAPFERTQGSSSSAEKHHLCLECGFSSPDIAEISRHMVLKHSPKAKRGPQKNKSKSKKEHICRESDNDGNIALDDESTDTESDDDGNMAPIERTERTQGSSSAEKHHQCLQCEFSSPDIAEVSCHMVLKHSPKAKRGPKKNKIKKELVCRDCGYYSTDRKNYKRHMWQHTGERPHKCTLCDSSFTNKTGLEAHMNKHLGEKPYKCDTCEDTFTTLKYLNQHKKKHSAPKRFICVECGYESQWKANLTKHQLKHSLVRGESKRLQCDDCDYSAVDKRCLDAHKKKHLRGAVKSHKCDDCSFSCFDKRNLLTHKQYCTGNMLFKCDECGFTCAQVSLLLNHKQSLCGEAGFKCDECGMAFTKQSSLKRHCTVKHSGEKQQ